MNICSVVVHAKPDQSDAVRLRLEEFPGVEVHGGGDTGKLIVTVEDSGDTSDSVADTMMAFNSVEGVISSTLIYHYGGDDLDEEVIRETD
jgi:nitrate reductase NapD